MLIFLAAFIFLLLFIGRIGGLPVKVRVPGESAVLAKEVAGGLVGTGVEEWVLAYGTIFCRYIDPRARR
jgi:hypothetical protein